MEWLMNGLKKLKEWIAKRRKEKSKIPLCVLQGQQAELIFVQIAQKKEAKPLPVYILGEYKNRIAEKIITTIEYILRYISKAVEAMFSKRKKSN